MKGDDSGENQMSAAILRSYSWDFIVLPCCITLKISPVHVCASVRA